MKTNIDMCNPVIYNKNYGTSYTPIVLLGKMEHMRELLQKAGFNPAVIQYVDFSNKMTKTLASTHRKNGEYWITFNAKFLATASEQSVNEVCIHEAIHLLEGCFNHGEKFKFVGRVMNETHGFHVARCTTDKKYHEVRIQMRKEKPHWILKCIECGKTYGPYLRAGKAVKSCLNEEHRFYCSKCGCRTLQVFHVEDGIETPYVYKET